MLCGVINIWWRHKISHPPRCSAYFWPEAWPHASPRSEIAIMPCIWNDSGISSWFASVLKIPGSLDSSVLMVMRMLEFEKLKHKINHAAAFLRHQALLINMALVYLSLMKWSMVCLGACFWGRFGRRPWLIYDMYKHVSGMSQFDAPLRKSNSGFL